MALPTQTPYNPRRFSNHPPFMLKAALIFTLCTALAACTPTSPAIGPIEPAEPSPATMETASSRNLIIFYDSPQAENALLATAERYGAILLHRYRNLHGIAVAIPADKDMAQAVTYFSRQPGVRQVLRDQIHPLDQQGIQ